MTDDLPRRKVAGATGGLVVDGKIVEEGDGMLRVMDPEHVMERDALNVAVTSTSLALRAAAGRAQVNGRVPASEAEKRRDERETCSECGRDLHGYRGPRCRYCDGMAE